MAFQFTLICTQALDCLNTYFPKKGKCPLFPFFLGKWGRFPFFNFGGIEKTREIHLIDRKSQGSHHHDNKSFVPKLLLDASWIRVFRAEFASMVMERVASEYNKLQYNVSHANGHPLIEEMTPRISQITTTLQNHLQDTFRSSLEHKDREKLIQSLQTYSSIGRQSAAEEMFQNVIVLPYMEQVSFMLKIPYYIQHVCLI